MLPWLEAPSAGRRIRWEHSPDFVRAEHRDQTSLLPRIPASISLNHFAFARLFLIRRLCVGMSSRSPLGSLSEFPETQS